MTSKMMAFRMTEWGQPPQKMEVDVPQVGPGQVLIKVAGVGLCGSDSNMQFIPQDVGDQLGWNMPFTLGHEAGGWIEQVGPGVTGFEPGEAVVLNSSNSCGGCSYCLEGQEHNCTVQNFGRGYGRDGSLAKYVLVENPREIIKLDKLDPRTAGPLVDAAATSYHGVKRLLPYLVPGSTVIVIGIGGLGSFAVQLLKVLSPARVIAVASSASRLVYARELGADDTINRAETDLTAGIRELAPEGAHVVMDFIGSDDTINQGISSLRKGGAFALVGSSHGRLSGELYSTLPKDGEVFVYEGASIAETREVISLAEEGKIRNDVDIYSFDEVEAALNDRSHGDTRGRPLIQMVD